MIVSAYDGDDEGNENRVCFWLRLDGWNLCEAAMVLVDINPDNATQYKKNQEFESVKIFRGNFYPTINFGADDICFLDDEMEKDYYESQNKLAIYQKKYDDIRRILYDNDDIEYDTPSYWIERAIAKK